MSNALILLPRLLPQAGVVFDSASTSGYEASLSTYSWTHVVGTGGQNRVLIVCVSIFATGTVTGITYNGVALTFVRSDATGVYRSEIWQLVAPATGSNTVAVTLSLSATSIANAESYTGVSQANPVQSSAGNTGTNTPASASMTAYKGARVVGNLATSAASGILPAAGQAQRTNNSGVLGTSASGDLGLVSVDGTKTLSWTGLSALDSWAVSLASLSPVADMVGSADGVGTASGTLAGSGALTASASGTGSGAATLAAAGMMAAAASGTGAADATASGVGNVSAAASGIGDASGTASGVGNVAASASGSGSADATASGVGNAIALAAGAGSADASVEGAGDVVAEASGTGSADATASGIELGAGSADGQGSGSGTAIGAGAVVASASGTGSADATLSASGGLVAAADGLGSANGSMFAIKLMVGSAQGVGSATGAIGALVYVLASASGTVTCSAELSGFGALSGSATGTATLSGAIRGLVGETRETRRRPVILPTPSKPVINATQLLNAFVAQWDLVWPEGVQPDPEDIVQSVERSQFANGPWQRVGDKIPGTVTHFVDLTVTAPESWFQRTFYRVVVRRVRR